MKFFFQFLVLLLTFNLTYSSQTYLVVLKSPLSLTSAGSGFQTFVETSVDQITSSSSQLDIEQNLKNSIFANNRVQGLKFFKSFVGRSLKSESAGSGLSVKGDNQADDEIEQFIYEVKLNLDEVEEFKEELEQLDDFIYFQPNYRYEIFSTPASEPNYNNLQTEIELMKFSDVWEYSSGVDVKVAVLDTGIYPQHQDICGTSVIYNESTQVMDVTSCSALDSPKDFIDGGTPDALDIANGILPVVGADYDTVDSAPMDIEGHGTHVSGIIGARVNNLGMGGVAYNATIIPVRVLAPYTKDGFLTGIGTTTWIVNGVDYAVQQGAEVINMSLGGTFTENDDQVMRTSIDNAYKAGVLVVAAAGNERVNFDTNKIGPAYFENVMSVSAINNLGEFASSYSNFGETLDVAAVGTSVYSLGIDSNNQYINQSGTSMSTPYVAGLAALIISYRKQNDFSYSPDFVRNLIQSTASNSGSKTLNLGYGYIDALSAMNSVLIFDSQDANTYPSRYLNQLLCYPNPFYRENTSNTSCTIVQDTTGSASYEVYSRRGQRVAAGTLSVVSDKTTFLWDGRDLNGARLPNGVYQMILVLTPSSGPQVTFKHLITLL